MACCFLKLPPFVVALVLFGHLSLSAHGQLVSARVHAGWGPNLLLSPGEDLTHRPGRTGYVGVGATVGKAESKLLFQPALRIVGSAYRTEMTYQVHFSAIRTTAELDLLAGFRQLSGTILQLGVFGGRVTSSSATLEQGRKSTIQPIFLDPRVRSEHFPTRDQAGVVLGLVVPLGEPQRFGLEFQYRQHLLAIMERPQSLALPFQPEQLVIAENSKPAILTVGLHYRFL